MFVVDHEHQKLLEILAPLDAHVVENLMEVLVALRIPATAIEWLHPRLPRAELLKRELLPPRVAFVVENNVVAQRLLGDVLQSNGYVAHFAGSMRELAELLATTVPDVIMLDADIPDIDRSGIARVLAEQPKDVHLIVFGMKEPNLDLETGQWHPTHSLTTASLLDALAEAHAKIN